MRRHICPGMLPVKIGHDGFMYIVKLFSHGCYRFHPSCYPTRQSEQANTVERVFQITDTMHVYHSCVFSKLLVSSILRSVIYKVASIKRSTFPSISTLSISSLSKSIL